MARKLIQPNRPPVVKQVQLPYPTKVLQEFVGYGAYNLRSVAKQGPKLLRYCCTASWQVVTDSEETRRFEQVRVEVGNVHRLFHGTPAKNISSITREGLRMSGAYCMFGKGIYFGAPAKAMGYTQKGFVQGAHYLLEAEVALGQSLVAPKATRYTLGGLREEGFHSVHGKAGVTGSWGGTLAHDEWVVYSTEQVRLLYVHEYQALSVEVQPTVQSHACQMAIIPQVWDKRGKGAFLDVLTKPRCCGGVTYTSLAITGGGEVWVCAACLSRRQIRVGDKFQVLDGTRLREVKVKG